MVSKKILFICKGNWYRSQIAAAIYDKYTNSFLADSVGTYVGSPDEPEGQILEDLFKNKDFFEVMESKNIYIRKNKTKKLTSEMIDQFEIVVSMAEEPFIPIFLKESKKVIVWDVENPDFVNKEIAEGTYVKIDLLVKKLIEENL
jgi:protein-tyrosine-phosphatase